MYVKFLRMWEFTAADQAIAACNHDESDQQSAGVSVSGGMSWAESEATMKLHMRFT